MTMTIVRSTVTASLIVLALAGGTACSSSGGSPRPSSAPATAPGSSGPVDATAGDLTITGGYIPQPASPDVAAAYFSVQNNGSTADRIVSVTSDVTSSVMAMTETTAGGVGTMTDLGNVTVPPHATTLFTPGHRHLMLENPSHRLTNGDHVRLTITFARAGKVVLDLPVVPLTGPSPGTR